MLKTQARDSTVVFIVEISGNVQMRFLPKDFASFNFARYSLLKISTHARPFISFSRNSAMSTHVRSPAAVSSGVGRKVSKRKCFWFTHAERGDVSVHFAHVIKISVRHFLAVCDLLILIEQGVEFKFALQIGQAESDF